MLWPSCTQGLLEPEKGTLTDEQWPWKIVYTNTGPQVNLDNPERMKESQDTNKNKNTPDQPTYWIPNSLLPGRTEPVANTAS